MLHVMPFMGPDLEINSILFYSILFYSIHHRCRSRHHHHHRSRRLHHHHHRHRSLRHRRPPTYLPFPRLFVIFSIK